MSTLVKTDGIVLDHVLYRENSAIVHLYTRELGRQNYIVNGVRGNRKSRKTLLLQPLSRLSLEVYHSPRKDLHRIKEFSLRQAMVNIPYQQSTRAQAFFLTELLSKVLTMQDSAVELYDFLDHSVELLDSDVTGRENLHLFAMFRLTKFLGFFPNQNNIGQGAFFDLKNGAFIKSEPLHPFFLTPGITVHFARLFDVDVFSLKNLARNASERQIMLEALMNFYQLHTHGLGALRSLAVLQSLLHS